jgi:radical SAM protein with 4Fe4S-binding SPASM domain
VTEPTKTTSRARGKLSQAADYASFAANLYLRRKNPISVIHFVTNRCNARCSFCFIDFDNPEIYRGELTIDEIDRISRTLGPDLKNVNLTGGEPFARKDFLDVARCYFRNTEIESIFITSNGSLPDRVEHFTKTLAGEFPDRKIIFSFSIDGLPEAHDRIRKIEGLFDSCLRSYRTVRAIGGNAIANISITVSHENYATAPALYESLIVEYGVKAITCAIVRDEGVYAIPRELKQNILAAYTEITGRIQRDLESGRLEGYDPGTVQGRLMNQKNKMMYGIIQKLYMEPSFIAPCQAGTLLGTIKADGTVYPCEILTSKSLGNLRDFDHDFMRLWQAEAASSTRRWIADTKCTCTFECAWSYNILSDRRNIPAFLRAGLSGALDR